MNRLHLTALAALSALTLVGTAAPAAVEGKVNQANDCIILLSKK